MSLPRRFPVLALITLLLAMQAPVRAQAAMSGPTNVKATSAAGTATATVSWTEPAGANRYRIKAYIGDVAVKTSGVLLGARTTFTFVGLEYEIPYVLKVEAGDGSTWSAAQPADAVTPVAAKPGPPSAPDLSVIADKSIEATWTEPPSNGGSPIVSYSVQLFKAGSPAGDAVTTKQTKYTFSTEDKTSQYSVTVKATNSAGKTSTDSEPSASVVAELKAAALVVTTPNQNPATPGNNSGQPSPGNPSSPAAGNQQTPSSATPAQNGSTQTDSTQIGSKTAPSYTKTVSINSSTSRKTLLAISRLSAPKGARVRYTLAPSSKKYCRLTTTAVKATRTGTCSVKVTVTVGKKSSTRTVRLTVGTAKKTGISREVR